MKPLLLASTSPYRAELLSRLNLPFTAAAPDCDETPMPAESASALVRRLSVDKARSLSAAYPDTLIIGSDQVCDLAGNILGKPDTEDRAIAQLKSMSSQTAIFRTGLCLMDTSTGTLSIDEVEVLVNFRHLSDHEIVRYVTVDQPLDCAGSFRTEGLGVSLLRSLAGPDPTALIGLPLIRLSEMLRVAGIPVP